MKPFPVKVNRKQQSVLPHKVDVRPTLKSKTNGYESRMETPDQNYTWPYKRKDSWWWDVMLLNNTSISQLFLRLFLSCCSDQCFASWVEKYLWCGTIFLCHQHPLKITMYEFPEGWIRVPIQYQHRIMKYSYTTWWLKRSSAQLSDTTIHLAVNDAIWVAINSLNHVT